MGPEAVLDLSELIEPTPRIQRLRERVVEAALTPPDTSEAALAAARSWLAHGGYPSHIWRRGRLAGDLLRDLTPVIHEDELLVGKFSRRALNAKEAKELDNWRRYGEPATSKAYGQRAHMAIDYERVLREGIEGVLAQIARYRTRLDLSRPDQQEQDFFYQGCEEALKGVLDLADKYADLAEKQAAASCDLQRSEELLAIAARCRKVPRRPAESFAEACQAAHFITFCMCAGNQMLLFQLGRPDRYLWPYYRKDLEAGKLTQTEALEYLACLGLLLNEYTPRGLAVGYMVGGRDEWGNDVANELTGLALQSIHHTRLAYPGIGLCWTPDTPEELLKLASKLLARGYSHPALFGDETISSGLARLGLPWRDACLYTHSTCVEITPIAISNVYVASPYYNLIQCLHDVLGVPPVGGQAAGEAPEIGSFEVLFERLRARIAQAVAQGTADNNMAMASRAQAGGFPLLSCFVNDCLSLGKDIDQGGARANWLEASFVGLANLVDSLVAIRRLVYEEGQLDLLTLRKALVADFEGYAEVQALLAGQPKYGNDETDPDKLARELTALLLAECEKHRSYWGDAVVPGFFCWIMHEQLGRQTLASPDGRRCGFPFADGSGPAQGREARGPTAMVCSVTGWEHAPMIGGIAVNFKFQPTRNPDDLVAQLQPVLKTFLSMGGFEAQVNVVRREELLEAQLHPELHRDLVVRVAGYSDYFVGLSPEMQAEVLMRSELNEG